MQQRAGKRKMDKVKPLPSCAALSQTSLKKKEKRPKTKQNKNPIPGGKIGQIKTLSREHAP